MEQNCFLQPYTSCSLGAGAKTIVGIERLIKASKARDDGLHEQIAPSEGLVTCHKNCVSTYTSTYHIKRYTATKASTSIDSEPVIKRRRRSQDNVTFNFKEHCIFCGDMCEMEPDPRHPSRWRRVIKCRNSDRVQSPITLKENILSTCEKRNDDWANQVRLRIQGAVSDLSAADAHYHKDCLTRFTSERNIKSSICNKHETLQADDAFEFVVRLILSDRSKIWNSRELYDTYLSNNGENLSRRQLVHSLQERFGEDFLMLSGDGIASLLLFKSKASAHLKIVENEDDDVDSALVKVTKQITAETKKLRRDTSKYDTRIYLQNALRECSPTLLRLFALLSANLESTLQAAMLGNMVSNAMSNTPTTLQIALGVLVRKKSVIEVLHDFGVTASYEEVRRFNASAAHAAAHRKEHLGISNSKGVLTQVVADNFDANISSQNGLQSTHALAILLTQVHEHQHNNSSETNDIKRLTKTEMTDDILPDVTVQRYNGPQKPCMPVHAATHSPLPLKVLTRQYISLQRAQTFDFTFLKAIVSTPGTPEFNGFNTCSAREQGHATKPKTKAVYLPLIDMAPAEPDTMLTAMIEAQRLTNMTGQAYTIFTNDQQLYRIVVHITWVYESQFINFIPRLGGMHTLMNFVGAVGTLMTDSGLEDILQTAFGGVAKMLSGKKFPQNIRALRLVVEELLRGIIDETGSTCYSDLMKVLEHRATQSHTTKVWLENLITPVLIMMLFVRAEREGDWPLHLLATQKMLPYFFAAGHFNYAR